MKNVKLTLFSCLVSFNFVTKDVEKSINIDKLYELNVNRINNVYTNSLEILNKTKNNLINSFNYSLRFYKKLKPVIEPEKKIKEVKLFIDTTLYKPEEIIEVGKKYLGVKYVWGSRNPNVGFDCSNYVSYVYKQVGINIPAGSRNMQHYGTTVDIKNIKPGDIIFFDTKPNRNNIVAHVALVSKVKYENNKQEITIYHAYAGGVIEQVLTNDKWLFNRILFIKRIL